MNKTLTDKALKVPVMETFYSIQGEGKYQGQAAFFIRLAGCDVGCHWCDVKESWAIADDQYVAIDALVAEAQSHATDLIIITGGEPFTHNLDKLTAALKEKDYQINVETAGVYPITGSIDWVCLSPKKFKEVLPEYYPIAHELKIVISNRHDIKWAEELAEKVSSICRLYLQPEWSKRDTTTDLIVEYVKNNPRWSISLQTHKYMNIP
ncbi:MAG: 7-carboxy-7-deazaguanine synthase QueE [Cyclobacteriaceae bacterium]